MWSGWHSIKRNAQIRSNTTTCHPTKKNQREKKRLKPQGYVQWNQLREKNINNTKPFERRRGLHNFDNFTIIHGYSEAYKHKHIFELSKQYRALPVNMAVLKPQGSDRKYYFVFLSVTDLMIYAQVSDLPDKILITWTPPPEIKPAFEKKEVSSGVFRFTFFPVFRWRIPSWLPKNDGGYLRRVLRNPSGFFHSQTKITRRNALVNGI